MQFPFPIVNRLVIFGSDGLPDVAIGPTPLIIFYSGTDEIIRIGIGANTASPNSPSMVLQDTSGKIIIDRFVGRPYVRAQSSAGDYIQMSSDNAGGILEYELVAGTGSARLYYVMYQTSPNRATYQLNFTGEAGVNVTFALEENPAGAGQIVANVPIKVLGEVWNNAVLQNAWTSAGVAPFNAVGYRLLPNGTVMLRGVATGGAIAAGTTVFNLPASYRPANRKQLVISMNAGTALTAVCQIIEASGAGAGNVNIYGVAAGNAIVFDGLVFPLGSLD